VQVGLRWVIERTNSWQAKLAHKKPVWCTERRGRVIDFWVALSDVITSSWGGSSERVGSATVGRDDHLDDPDLFSEALRWRPQ
jgi:hypothetical protein